MGTPYSNDLRLRVPAAVDGGVPVRQVAALLRVSVSYIYKALCRADARPASSRAMSRRC
jgi:transposase